MVRGGGGGGEGRRRGRSVRSAMSDPLATLRAMKTTKEPGATEFVLVRVTRELELRMMGDYVMHWDAVAVGLRLRVTGRSFASVEKKLRRLLVERLGWSDNGAARAIFHFEVQETTPEIRAALEAHERAAAAARVAQAEADVAARDLIRKLLLGPPILSVRDTARVVGVAESFVARVARCDEVTRGRSRARAKEKERRDILAKQRAAARAKFLASEAKRRGGVVPVIPG